MSKLMISPENSSYAVVRGSEVLSSELQGGSSKMRLDVLNAAFTINVAWSLSPVQYEYINAFFRTKTKHGSLPFTIDLILDNTVYTEYTARFIPDTFKLASQKGLTYYVNAVLEVESVIDNATTDDATVAAYEALIAP